MQPGYYAGFKSGSLYTVLISDAFHNCEKENQIAGCLYKYDDPDKQCKGNRRGWLKFISAELLYLHSDFKTQVLCVVGVHTTSL